MLTKTLYKLKIYSETLRPKNFQTTENEDCLYNLILAERRANEFTKKFNKIVI